MPDGKHLLTPHLVTNRLLITIAPPDAAPRVVAFLRENADHFRPWDPPPRTGVLTEAHWRERLARNASEFREGRALALMLFHRDQPEAEVVGTCDFTNLVRGPFQACTLGYRIAERHQGKGLMHEALQAAIGYVFGDLCLHRIMANYIPSNTRSARLLTRLGFRVEGTAKEYLFIDGAWQDHVLTSLTHPDWRGFRWY